MKESDLEALATFLEKLRSLAQETEEQVDNAMLFYALARIARGELPLTAALQYYAESLAAQLDPTIRGAQESGAGIADQWAMLEPQL